MQFTSTDMDTANINFVLALYKHGSPQGWSAPSIVVYYSNGENRAAAVRTCYDAVLEKTSMKIIISGPDRETEHEALKMLFDLTKDAVKHAMALSNSERGFDDWNQLMRRVVAIL